MKMGKKGKAPAFWTAEVDMEPFMKLKVKDLVKTPLGVVVAVLGVKYETKSRGDPGTGVLWVQYPGRYLAPLEKDITGYARLSDGDHIWRDLEEFKLSLEDGENERAIIDADNAKYAAELIAANEKKNKKNKKK